MKKTVFILFSIGLYLQGYSQIDSQKLKAEFRIQHIDNQSKLDRIIQNLSPKSEAVEDMKSRLAGFIENRPVFWRSADKPANRSANVIPLQDGTLAGLNGTKITGTGILVTVFDGGRVLENHNEFVEGGVSRVTNKEASTVEYSSHGTNVTGLIIANGSGNLTNYEAGRAQGVLSTGKVNAYSFKSTALGTNYEKLTSVKPNISNHSYGIATGWYYDDTTVPGWYWFGDYELNTRDTYSGAYAEQDANFDKIVYDNSNVIVVKSAGNYFGDGPSSTDKKFKWDSALEKYVEFLPTDVLPDRNCNNGYNCIGWGSLAKNIIVVGATEQLTTTNSAYASSADVIKAAYSSAGPRKDGAIKPDITAVGSQVVAPTYDTTNATVTNKYTKGSGTSYAAPVITGIIGSLTQINRAINGDNTLAYKADEIKALLTHSAQEAGWAEGPDVHFGWGFVDAKKAAEIVIGKKNNTHTFVRNTMTNGAKFTKDLVVSGNEPLKATISWIDPAATPFTSSNDLQNNTASRLVNDLDLRIIDTMTNEIYYPWKLDINNYMGPALKGDNIVDNVEQVLIANPVAGRTYRVEVSNKGTLKNASGAAASQDYALIITGYSGAETTPIGTIKEIDVFPTVISDKVNNILTVYIPTGGRQIDVYDASGRLAKTVTVPSGATTQTIGFAEMSKGVYTINILTANVSVSKKVIKQ